MALTLLFVTLIVLLVIGAPVAVSLGLASLVYILIDGLPDVVLAHNMINGIDSFPLLAIPFFILAGHLMNTAGITTKIFAFARAMVGWMHGGLGHVNVGASVIFAGMSGAAVADAGGLGNIEIKAMRDADYDDEFSVGITAASSIIGPIIPPSLPLVIYGVMASVSIGELFAAGLIPGLLMALSLMIMIAYYAKKRNYPRDSHFELAVLSHTFKKAILPLLTPVIIIGGVSTGVFTPTESAVAAVMYSLLLGLVVYKTLTWRHIVRVSMDTIETTAAILMIIASAAVFAWVLTANQVAQHLGDFLLNLSDNKTVILLIIMVLVLLIGMFMETIAAMTILVPILIPITTAVGIDPVHLGIIVVLNLMLGLLTPPVGMVLYVLSDVSGVSFEKCVKSTAPFLIPLIFVLLLITFVPEIVLYLPEMFYR
ncbi:TRAP transporter large permease [Cocleimonas sp. KMM 6892]|uniref:TRAP transporter large permease n=1 Tax=unclassified Cocleimonas TaxID=2639732 RepID=UPI002DB87B48|nr:MULTISPECIES: TRAP transporter large permease [unclassified Cocleimonas]MEB8433795.1 TRAP transporter large permease [Cocleimonas sp. KMM 6892]MEC4716606.1 TRAP transporter large permease [Cocleimonas sp. KMM 6895]MEC4746239.1 TRAP transporter large permease [Cocleimonas sp. KMM 6896]